MTVSSPRLGLGCWPLSGPMFMNGVSVGYASCPADQATRVLHAAHDAGITLFDTAQAYGAGHGERLIGDALRGRDVTIVTKIGLAIDETSQTITGPRLSADEVAVSVHESLNRLKRDHIDCVLLHPNEATIAQAEAIFDKLTQEVDAGTITSFGWSTDFPENARAQLAYPHARYVEHVMNVFLPAKDIRAITQPAGVTSLIRSPLAMGVLAGRFSGGETIKPGDVRIEGHSGMDWFQGSAAHPRFIERLDAVRELLCTGGRNLAQGALCWLLAHGTHIVPVPGASSVEQAVSNAEALAMGPLPVDIVAQINALVPEETGPNRPV